MTKEDKVISIKVRLLGIILPIIIIIMLVLTGLSYYVSKKSSRRMPTIFCRLPWRARLPQSRHG